MNQSTSCPGHQVVDLIITVYIVAFNLKNPPKLKLIILLLSAKYLKETPVCDINDTMLLTIWSFKK